MRFLVVPSLLIAVIVFSACSGGDTKTVTVRETVTVTTSGTVPGEAPAVVTLYFLRDGKVAPVARSVVAGPDTLEVAALDALVAGPTQGDGVETALAADTIRGGFEIADDLAIVALTPEPRDRAARAQVVYTLTALPNVKRVSFGGASPVGRKAFEAQTPSILVESPLPGDEVEPGFEATGTANTFEATFQYELRDASGKILKKDFVTATSGSGTRGTFRFTVPYEVASPQTGRLVVFEISAADGSRTHESSIPLALR